MQNNENPPKKRKKALIITIIVILLFIVAAIAVFAILKYRDNVRAERAAYYAEQEANMVAETFTFTITPGETIYDVQERLRGPLYDKNGNETGSGYSEAEIAAAFNPSNYDYAFLDGLDSLEGYLYGETYEFYADETAQEVIGTYLKKMSEVIEENNLEEKYAAQSLSLHEGIILASIVQKEASAPDMKTVAQVFLSRLNYGIVLGSDVTVSYALDTVDPDRTSYSDNASALAVNSCYNTRLYAGLPCGAISNPGLTALNAVANPSDTSYLYFLTGDDGVMYYSYTEYEHNQNAAAHCQTLCNVSL